LECNVGEKKELKFFVSPQAKPGTYEASIILNTQQPDVPNPFKEGEKKSVDKLPEHSESILFKIEVK
jgi:hypothetical protein